MSKILSIAKKIMSNHYLCDNCLGRMFGGLSRGLSNDKRGRAIRETVKMDIHLQLLEGKRVSRKLLKSLISLYNEMEMKSILEERGVKIAATVTESSCEICCGLFNRLDDIMTEILPHILEYEFTRYVVGVTSLPEYEEREERIKMKYGLWFSESIRSELSRELGKKLDMKLRSVNRTVEYDPSSPEATIIIDITNKTVEIETRPIQIYFELYREKNRSLFAKNCKSCGGRGCETCGFTGKEAGNSLEYVLGKAMLMETGGKRWRFSIKYLDRERDEIEAYLKIIGPKKRNININNFIKTLDIEGFTIVSARIEK